ncbi:hypothetical protein BDQ12DRAFT_714679 [Crucibulum laeve]|uniref:DUF6534 domain-containing protein n=1 Tax=Crucibulum laeve TaxID=68775 RepID=A0A5C3LQU8_9AGAR|nr:hypothetical protein BDQ12DRAFT_714679 [Crucibulum laeve]
MAEVSVKPIHTGPLTWIETDTVWRMLVVGWGDVSVFQQISYSSSLGAAFSGIASTVVQLFFAWRIRMLCRGANVVTAIAALIAALSLMQGISAVCVTVIFIQRNRIPALMYTIYLPMQVWSIGSLLCDIMIAGTMAALLSKARARSPFKSTDKMINRLMTITIETGSVTVFVAIIQFALYMKYPMSYIYLAPMYILLSTYSNVLLATLNGRDRVRQYANETMYTTDIMSAIRSAGGRDRPTSATRNVDQNTSIGVTMLRISPDNRAHAGTDTDLPAYIGVTPNTPVTI